VQERRLCARGPTYLVSREAGIAAAGGEREREKENEEGRGRGKEDQRKGEKRERERESWRAIGWDSEQ